MHSHHSHSGAYCAHAGVCTPQSMIEHAIKLGLTSFHLTEHIPRFKREHLYPEELEADLDAEKLTKRFEGYLVEARKVAQKAMQEHKGFECLVGAETENLGEPESIEDLLRALEGDRFDASAKRKAAKVGAGRVQYLVGGVHHVKGVPIDFDKATFQEALTLFHDKDGSKTETLAHLRLAAAYFDAQYELMQAVEPEVIAHFDLVRLWTPELPLLLSAPHESFSAPEREALRTVDEKVTRNVRYAVSYGALFEVSGAALRKGWSTPYPGQEIIQVSYFCLQDERSLTLLFHSKFCRKAAVCVSRTTLTLMHNSRMRSCRSRTT